MFTFIKNHNFLTLVALIIITLISGGTAFSHVFGGVSYQTLGAIIILLAFLKVWLVMFHFMEVRRASGVLKFISYSWLILGGSALLITYLGFVALN